MFLLFLLIDCDCVVWLVLYGFSEGCFIVLFLLYGVGGVLVLYVLVECVGVIWVIISGLFDGL